MSACQIRKSSFLEASRHQSTPMAVFNNSEVSLKNTNLESYKKALHSIVRRLNKTPTSNSKGSLKRLDPKLNQTQQPLNNSTFLSNSQSQKTYYMNTSSVAKNQSAANRSQSNDKSPYKTNKELLNSSLNEPYLRKDPFISNVPKSVSINKIDKRDLEEVFEEKLAKGDFIYAHDTTLNATLLNETNSNHLDSDGDKKLRDLVNRYQLRDSLHQQEIEKLKKSNDSLRSKLFEIEKEVEKTNKNRDLDKRYIAKLEEETINLKEKLRLEGLEKKSTAAVMAENKENQYLKIIDDLKAQNSNLGSEKKLVEHLLKNALQQKENGKEDKKLSNEILNTLESSNLAITSCKYSNTKERAKTVTNAKKPTPAGNFNDENDYGYHSQYQALHSSFVSMQGKPKKESENPKQVNTSLTVAKSNEINEEHIMKAVVQTEEGDEPFPKKVFHPRLNEKSLKERIDMSQFKLDLTRISKSRKVE